jgi:hypothetical protein
MLGSVLKTKQALCSPTDCKELTSVKAVLYVVIQWVHGPIASYCYVSEICGFPHELIQGQLFLPPSLSSLVGMLETCLNSSMMIMHIIIGSFFWLLLWLLPSKCNIAYKFVFSQTK